MPTNKNAMTRYKILDELLSNRYHNYSLDDLTEEVCKRLAELYPDTNGVCRRAIEKDIHYLEYEGPFLVEIERYTVSGYNREKQSSFSKRCLRYANPSFSIFKKEMSDDEEYLLKEALSMLGQFDGLPNLEALEDLSLGLGGKKFERKIISFTKNPLEKTNLIGLLFTAISQQQVIEIQYHKFNSPEKVLSLNVFPYLLKEYNRSWFLFAAAETDEKLLCFALDRIDKIEPLPSHRYIDYKGDINGIFKDIIGVTANTESPLYRILFWVSDESKEYAITKPLHESQISITGQMECNYRKKLPTLEGGRFFQISCKENYELIRELMSFGENLIVLSPSDIRDKILNKINYMQQHYKNIQNYE